MAKKTTRRPRNKVVAVTQKSVVKIQALLDSLPEGTEAVLVRTRVKSTPSGRAGEVVFQLRSKG